MKFPRYVGDQYRRPARFKVLYGGRASGKSWSFAALLILLATQQTKRIVVCRYTAVSILRSSRVTLMDTIHRLGLGDVWAEEHGGLLCDNGSTISFHGLGVSREHIRGWEGVDIVWMDESQTLPEETANILIPTIRRAGSELWFSFNPIRRSDWVWQRFVVNPKPTDLITKVSWRDVEAWLAPEVIAEKDDMKARDEALYRHIWEGEPMDGSGLRVLPYHYIEAAQAITEHLPPAPGKLHAGLDIADSGSAKNALITRRGPRVESIRQWQAQTLGETARRAARICTEESAAVLFYDSGGVGAGVRSYLNEMHGLPFALEPESFGGKVRGPRARFNRRMNADHFARRNSQLAWSVRMRAENSHRWMEDRDSVKLDECLSLPADLSTDVVTQLLQPEWATDPADRITIDKAPDGAPSPDVADGLFLAFAGDSWSGLRAA